MGCADNDRMWQLAEGRGEFEPQTHGLLGMLATLTKGYPLGQVARAIDQSTENCKIDIDRRTCKQFLVPVIVCYYSVMARNQTQKDRKVALQVPFNKEQC